MLNLITIETLRRFEDVPLNLKPERLQIAIRKAQELDLKPFLGYALYYDLVKHLDTDGTLKDDALQHYKDLLNGTEYLDEQGYVVLYQGLNPVLSYFAFARFLEDDAVHYTTTGPVMKQTDKAMQPGTGKMAALVQQQRSIANAYANETERFLFDHKTDFPAWHYNQKNKSARQAGPRIRAVDITDFNFPTDDYTTDLSITEFLN